jgi:hypothetical protein
MATFSKLAFQATTMTTGTGLGVKVAATASSGTTIHTAANVATTVDEIWLYAQLNNPFSSALTVSNKALTSNVATITTSAAHGLFVGDTVKITGVDTTFNGTWTITTVPSTTTFTYARTATNVTSTASSGSVFPAATAASQNVRLTVQWGATTSPDDEITYTLTNQNGLYLICPGLVLQGNATPKVVRAYADVANVVTIHGYVNRITA